MPVKEGYFFVFFAGNLQAEGKRSILPEQLLYTQDGNPMNLYYTVRLDNGACVCAEAPEELSLKKNDICVIRRDFYSDCAKVCILHGSQNPDEKNHDLAQVQRLATEQDIATAAENLEKSRGSFRTAIRQVELLNLPMKLLNCHHSLDNKLVTVQFTADGRVDFRELVKEL